MFALAMIMMFLCMVMASMFLGGNAFFNGLSNILLMYLAFVVAYLAMRRFIKKEAFVQSFKDEFFITNFIYLAFVVWGIAGVYILRKLGYFVQISFCMKDLLFHGSVIVSIIAAMVGLNFTVYPYEPDPLKKN